MRSSFFEFNVAISSLFTAKSALQVTSHNMANSAVSGYSRQVALQRASKPIATHDGKGMVGTGSEVYGIGQIRDTFLDQKYWTEKCVLGNYTVKNTQLSLTEIMFNEVAGTGLTDAFGGFFAKLSDLSTTASEPTFRTNVLQAGQSLAQTVNALASNIKKQQGDLNNELYAMVDVINSLGNQITSLNRQIYKSELDGSSANDLRDARVRLIDELSIYCNVEVTEMDYSTPDIPHDKRLVILLNGYDFVSHYDTYPLEAVERDTSNGEKKNPMDIDGLYDLKFKGSNLYFNLYSPTLKGELKGLIDVRDGNAGNNQQPPPGGDPNKYATTKYKGLPYYMNKLNELVQTFAKAINEGKDKNNQAIPDVIGHRSGFDENGNPGGYLFLAVGADGQPLPGAFDYTKITCDNFAINPDILKNPELLACSDKPTDTSGESNNEVILNFANISTYKSLFREGKLLDFTISITSEMAIDIEQAKKFEANYTDVIAMVDNQRISVAGVDMSEETLNMVRFQQLYLAASKLVNIIDSIYDTTINRLGAF